ncbi:putative Rab/GTPase [Macrolepiota fuliginosa MF-IS2]|uniref:Rab/GTPase n=1 Tax=Macrolepiota fuliginosa MF-IS2 TaxID=1400762 RepID=A0A9P5WZF4_9AGAR|nr:putative Rab/GTPase [Macrolepiota fuliginosa MF-IS2]
MDRPTRFDHQAKVVCIGNSGVGKSSLTIRFCNDEWSPSFISTVGVDFKFRIVDVDGVRVRLLIWDTAGQDRFKSITKAYYRGSEGVLLVYDVSDYPSFQGIRKWVDELEEAGLGDSERVPKLLVGNKTDASDRAVSTEQGRKLAEEIGALFCETSAKYSDGVTAAFTMLARDIKKKRIDPRSDVWAKTRDREARPGAQINPGIVIVRKPAPKTWGSCCSSEQCVGYTEEVRADVPG